MGGSGHYCMLLEYFLSPAKLSGPFQFDPFSDGRRVVRPLRASGYGPDRPNLDRAHPKGGAPPPKKKTKTKINRENLKVGLKFSVLESITFGLVGAGSIPTKLFKSTFREAGVITLVQILQGLPQKIWEGKIVRKSAQFLITFDFDREYL